MSKTNMTLPSQNLEWWKQVTCNYNERDIMLEEIHDDWWYWARELGGGHGGVPINILVLFLACYRIVLLYRLLSMIMGLTLVTYMWGKMYHFQKEALRATKATYGSPYSLYPALAIMESHVGWNLYYPLAWVSEKVQGAELSLWAMMDRYWEQETNCCVKPLRFGGCSLLQHNLAYPDWQRLMESMLHS